MNTTGPRHGSTTRNVHNKPSTGTCQQCRVLPPRPPNTCAVQCCVILAPHPTTVHPCTSYYSTQHAPAHVTMQDGGRQPPNTAQLHACEGWVGVAAGARPPCLQGRRRIRAITPTTDHETRTQSKPIISNAPSRPLRAGGWRTALVPTARGPGGQVLGNAAHACARLTAGQACASHAPRRPA